MRPSAADESGAKLSPRFIRDTRGHCNLGCCIRLWRTACAIPYRSRIGALSSQIRYLALVFFFLLGKGHPFPWGFLLYLGVSAPSLYQPLPQEHVPSSFFRTSSLLCVKQVHNPTRDPYLVTDFAFRFPSRLALVCLFLTLRLSGCRTTNDIRSLHFYCLLRLLRTGSLGYLSD